MDTNIGRLVAYVGAMGCGKTKKLIDLYEEMVNDGVRVAIFKPFIAREGEEDEFIYARNGKKAPATAVDYLAEIPSIVDLERLEAVLVDETQFFDEEEDSYMILEGLALGGLEVYVFGLDVDSENNTFGHMGDILAHADEVHKLRTACVKCGEEARVSKFVGEHKEGIVQVGDLDDYAPHCRACYCGWSERLRELRKKVSITLGRADFFFTCEVDAERITEMGYDLETLKEELQTIDEILEFIAKLKKSETE